MGIIVTKETYEVTVGRVEYHDGRTEFFHRIGDEGRYGDCVAVLNEPDRQPLAELAYNS